MGNPSLLPGRNSRPLTPEQKGQIERELRENLSYEGPIVWRDGPATKSCFAPGPDPTGSGEEVGILYIGSDILPVDSEAAKPTAIQAPPCSGRLRAEVHQGPG